MHYSFSMSKRIIKIRFALNLSEDDLGFARLYQELLEIEVGSGVTPTAVLSAKRRILLKVLHGYCQNTSAASSTALTNATATRVEQTSPIYARTHGATEKTTSKAEMIPMPRDAGEPEQAKTLDEIFNEGMQGLIDFDEPQSIINEG